MVELHEQQDAIRATRRQAEHRSITEDEQNRAREARRQFDALDDEVKAASASCWRSEKLADARAAAVTRPTEPREPRQRITGGDAVGVTKGSVGLPQHGRVREGGQRGRAPADRQAPHRGGDHLRQRGTQADGGYAVPPDFRETIVKKVQARTACSRAPTSSSRARTSSPCPLDNTTPWQTTGGIQVYWEGEAATYTRSRSRRSSSSR
jgi:HK97 family phage major capsid protein